VASKTVVELVDDLDGGRADETVHFAIDGAEYEIDLSAKNAAKLRAALATFVGHAKKGATELTMIAEATPPTEATATLPPEREAPRARPVRHTPEPRPAPVRNRQATKATTQSLAAQPKSPPPAQPTPHQPGHAKPGRKTAERKTAEPAARVPEPQSEPQPETTPTLTPEPKKRAAPSGPAAALFIPFSEAQN
jgi:nucleoid-associated protein Lsr2